MILLMTLSLLMLASLGLCAGLAAADLPETTITNGSLRVKLYLPDANKGFYRGTRFDWSGTIYSLRYQGHDYYGPWFRKTDPALHDFIYKGDDIVAAPCSATSGPAEEFGELGWAEAAPGGTFIKIGVGALRKPDNGAYDKFHLYEIVDTGKWTVHKKSNAVEFTQTLKDKTSGYSYVYRKTVRLLEGKPEMVLEHSLKNTGARAIRTSVYNHNFLVLDHQAPGPDFTITFPFQVASSQPPRKSLAEIRGNQIVYLKTLEGHENAACSIEGFGTSASDHEIRIENRRVGMGVKISADRPLASEYLWSIRTVLAVEPFIAIAIEPGREFAWASTYSYYALPPAK